MSETSKMSFFSENFAEENKRLHDITKNHENRMEDLKNDPDERKREDAAFRSRLGSLASDILAEDRARRLTFPFKLNAKNVEKIGKYPTYYEHDGIVERTSINPTCITCGKTVEAGNLAVYDVKSSVCTCLDCVDVKHPVSVDGEDIKILFVR